MFYNPSVSYADTSPCTGEALSEMWSPCTGEALSEVEPPCTGEASSEIWPPYAKGAPAKRVGNCLLQPLRHGYAEPPPLHKEGEALISGNYAVPPPPGLLRSPHTGEALSEIWPPCAKGAGSAYVESGGLFLHTYTTLPSRLRRATSPSQGRGGFN